jgi:hypothetical protein
MIKENDSPQSIHNTAKKKTIKAKMKPVSGHHATVSRSEHPVLCILLPPIAQMPK